MAALQLPPRKTSRTQEVTIMRNRSSLDVLMQMGFPTHRAEKALAATGDKGVQLASDWLLSHVNDPGLDDLLPRDYILYLCPVGQLQQQLLGFWHQSYEQCGWNRAHNYFPHITLCSFFKAEDSQATPLSHGLRVFAEKLSSIPNRLQLEYFSSTNFIGLFVSENCAQFLKQVTTEFAEEAKKLGVTVEPHKKQLHVSLAYQFPTDMKEKLETLAKGINMEAPVRWDIRLYSRDQRTAKCQVRKVVYPHNSRAEDELDLIDGDFLYVDEEEVESSIDGWYKGTSWLTGLMGVFPGNFTERTAGSETWTLHRSMPIIGTDVIPQLDMNRASTSPLHNKAGSRVIEASRRNRALESSLERGTETLPARLPELTTIRNIEINGPLTADNILYTAVGEVEVTPPPRAPPPSQSQGVAPPMLQPLSATHKHGTVSKGATAANTTNKSTPSVPGKTNQPAQSTPHKPTGPSSQSSPHKTTNQTQNQQHKTQMNSPMPPPKSQSNIQHKQQSSAQNTPGRGSNVQPTPMKSSNTAQQSSQSSSGTERKNSTTPTSSPRPQRHKMAANVNMPSNMSPKKMARNVNCSSPVPSLSEIPKSRSMEKSQPPTTRMPSIEGMKMTDMLRPQRPYAGPRQLYVIRHGERVDFTFGKDWINQSFDSAGNYIRHDLNMPRTLPKRKMGPADFVNDSPLTVQGHFQAKIVGEALHEKDVPVSYIYSSPSLRCIETASSLLEGLGIEREINVEPGLFEWLGWYQCGLPRFMGLNELRENGYKVSTAHNPIWPQSKFNLQETTEQYYDRCHHVTREILKKHEYSGGTILILAHAASLDVCTRQLLGSPTRNHAGFHDVLHKVPYLAMAVCQEDCDIANRWSLVEPPVLAFAHTSNPKYNYDILTVPYMV